MDEMNHPRMFASDNYNIHMKDFSYIMLHLHYYMAKPCLQRKYIYAHTVCYISIINKNANIFMMTCSI